VKRTIRAVGAAVVLATSAACTAARSPAATPAAAGPPSQAVVVTSGSELPAGAGKTILDTACTTCHGLNEVTKFGGFYNRQQWRDIVVTMVEYGAPVKMPDVDVLADYLNAQLGRRN